MFGEIQFWNIPWWELRLQETVFGMKQMECLNMDMIEILMEMARLNLHCWTCVPH